MKVQGLILVLLLPLFARAQEQYYGTRLLSMALSGAESKDDLQTLPIHAGDTLTPQNVRASIQALYDTGHYSYIEVEATAAANGGTDLTFRVKPNYFFSTVRIDPDNILERPLSSYFRLPFGERFTTTAIDSVIENTLNSLKAGGYFEAKVSADKTFDEETHLVVVTLKADPGPKAKVGTVNVHGGEDTFSHLKIGDAFGLKMGDSFTTAKLDKGISAVRAKFTELDFLNTRVNVDPDPEHAYNATTHTVDLDVTVQPGQFAYVKPIGFDISKKKLRELVPIFEEGAVDRDLVDEGSLAITRYLQQEGHFDAQVMSEIIEIDPVLANAIQINYTINPGLAHHTVEVRIDGNKRFSVDDIRSRMKTRSGELLNRALFSQDILEADRRTIETMYQDAGFEGTVVTATPEDIGHAISVSVHIQEGTPLVVDSIRITGNVALSEDELRGKLRFKESDSYVPGDVDQGRAALTQLYYGRGYADARVERAIEHVASTRGVRVSFEITEGLQYQVGDIIIAGNTKTRAKFIRRGSGLESYKPFNPEKVLEGQQRLYATGLFSRVEIVPLDQGLAGIRNILIQVEEAKPILLTYGVGYQEFEHARGTVEISHNDLFGLGRSLSLRVRGSSRGRLAQTTYKQPQLFNHNIDGFATALVEHTVRPTFTYNRVDFSLETLKRFTNEKNFRLFAGYQTVNLEDIAVNPHANSLPAERGIFHIARVGFSFIQDRRDNAVNPTRGTFNTSTFQIAGRAIGSQINFTSLYDQYSVYAPLRGGVVATSVRLGWNHPFASTTQTGLPPTERYFAGGSTTLRGFGFDQAQPSGGNVMTIANLEYRTPLRVLPVPNVGGAVFYDTGNVFPRIGDIHVKDFTHTVGLGLRYQTPLGPVRIDFGINLKPEVNGLNEKRLHVFFTLGNPF